jgi:tetratricopeptide (TPR) repeat protein
MERPHHSGNGLVTFVGDDRHALVDRLDASFDEAIRLREPRLVSLEAAQGWGKTRIVQAFYDRLAERQAEPAYWPATLAPAAETNPFHRRKRVAPTKFRRGAAMPWMWWGLSCGRRQGDGLEHVLAEDVGLLELHLQDRLAAEAERNRLKQEGLDTAKAVFEFGLEFTQVDTLLAGADVIRNVSRLAGHVVRARPAAEGVAVMEATDPGRAPLVERVAELIATTAADGLPYVLVIDDAHDADASVTALLDRIVTGQIPGSILCVLTAWPDRLAQQTARGDGPGAWLEGVCERQPDRCRRESLARLEPRDLATIVRARAPATEPDVINAFAQRADGNPFVLETLLNLPKYKPADGGDAIAASALQVSRESNNLADIAKDLWQALPLHVRQALSLCTLQGREAVESLVLHSYEIAMPAAAARADEALAEAVDPHAWIRRIRDVVRFDEQYTFEIARRRLDDDHLSPEQVAAARRSIAQRIAAWRTDGDAWLGLPEATRQAVRAIHVEIARAGDADDLVAAAGSAREVVAGALDAGLAAQGAALAEEALGWLTEDGELRLGLRLLVARGRLAVGDPAEGRRQLEGVLAAAESALSPEHPVALEARTALARLLIEIGDWGPAAETLDRLIEDSERNLGPDDDTTLDARALRAIATLHAGDFDEAKAQLDELLPHRERVFGETHPDAVELRLIRANLTMGDQPERAKEIQEEVVHFAEEALGSDHPHVLDARSTLAQTIRDLGYYREARALQQQTIADCERVLGARHPTTLTERVNLAQTLVLAGDPAGTPIQREAAAALEQQLGPDHPTALAARRAMAETVAQQGDFKSARLALQRLLGELEERLGERHPQTGATRRVFAGVLLQGARDDPAGLALARDLCEADYAERMRALGARHPLTLAAAADLALARVLARDEDGGRELLHGLLGDLEDDALEAVAARQLAGDVLVQLGADEDAATVYRTVLEGRRRVLGSAHARTIEALLRFAAVLERHVPADAQLYTEEAYEHAKETHGRNHPVTVAALYRVAMLARQLGDSERACSAFERLAVMREEILGADHLETLRTRYYVAEAQRDLGEHEKAKAAMEGVVAALRRVVTSAEADLAPGHPYTVGLQSELAYILDVLGAVDEARAAAPVVGGTLSAPLPRGTFSKERLVLTPPGWLAEVRAETYYLPAGALNVPNRRARLLLLRIVSFVVAFVLGILSAVIAQDLLLLVPILAVAIALWGALVNNVLPTVFGLNATARRYARARAVELASETQGFTELALEPIELADGRKRLRRRFETGAGDARRAQTEVYTVHGQSVLTAATSVPVRFAEERAELLDRVIAGISFIRPGLPARARRDVLRKLGRARVRGAIRARLPRGWRQSESLMVGRLDGGWNIITSVESIEAGIESKAYAETQGQAMANEFTGYEELLFEEATVFSGRPGCVRAFSWRENEESEPVFQWQAYTVEPGRGYTATATCRGRDAEKLREPLRRRIAQTAIEAHDAPEAK